jgi:hypothetical protein
MQKDDDDEEIFPGSQSMHTPAPAKALYLPGSQSMHIIAAVVVEYLPPGQN